MFHSLFRNQSVDKNDLYMTFFILPHWLIGMIEIMRKYNCSAKFAYPKICLLINISTGEQNVGWMF